MKPTLIIAIDPDTERSGIATLHPDTRELSLRSLPLPELLHTLFKAITEKDAPDTLHIVVEAGWLNAPNWHVCRNDSPAVIAAKGRSIGRNEQVSRTLIDYAKWVADISDTLYVEVTPAKPLRKTWQGKDRKITHTELAAFIPHLPRRTNQEERDAALLAWTYAGLPIRIKPVRPMPTPCCDCSVTWPPTHRATPTHAQTASGRLTC